MPKLVTPESDVIVKRRKYNRLMTQAEMAYKQAVDAAKAEFEKLAAPATEKFNKAIVPHQVEFEKVTADAAAKRDAAIQAASDVLSDAHAEASKAAGYTS